MDLFSLIARLTLDSSEYDKGLAGAGEKASGFASKLKKGFGVAAAAATAVVGAASAAATAVAAQVGQVAAVGDNIDKASQKLGISAEAYQEWDAVLQHSGTSIDSMGVGMKTLASAAASGKDAFEALGISTERAASMSREDLFAETVTALQNVTDENKRAQLAQELFGRSAMELGPLLNTSAADTQAMRERVHELGGVMSNEAVKAAAAYQDSLQDMQTALEGTKRNMLTEFLPAITTVMDGLTGIFSGQGGLDKLEEGIGQFTDKLSSALPRILEIGSWIVQALGKAIVQNLPKLISAATQTIISLGNGLVQQLPMLVQAGLQIILQLATSIADALPELIPTIVDVVVQIVDTLTQPDTLSNLVDAAIQIIIALAEGLIDALPRLIEAAPKIITNLVTALVNNAPKLLEAGVQLIAALASGIIQNVGAVVRAIGDIGRSIFDGIGDIIRGAWDWGKDLVNNFAEGIKSFINKPIEAVKGLAGKIKGFLGFSEPEEGPLSNFSTYAPDMMALFARGITDNEHLITDAIGDAFNLRPSIFRPSISKGAGAPGQEIVVPRGGAEVPRDMTVIFKLSDDTELGRAVYRLYNNEQQRVGMRLSTGGAY